MAPTKAPFPGCTAKGQPLQLRPAASCTEKFFFFFAEFRRWARSKPLGTYGLCEPLACMVSSPTLTAITLGQSQKENMIFKNPILSGSWETWTNHAACFSDSKRHPPPPTHTYLRISGINNGSIYLLFFLLSTLQLWGISSSKDIVRFSEMNKFAKKKKMGC